MEITFNGVDIKKDLSNNDAGVDEHDWTEKRLNLVATQEFHKSLTSSAYKTPKTRHCDKSNQIIIRDRKTRGPLVLLHFDLRV